MGKPTLTVVPPGPQLSRSNRLALLKIRVGAGLAAIADVAQALHEILHEKLYVEEGFETFESFCQKNWGIEKSRAYQLADFHQVRTNLSTTVEKADLPKNERQARPLAGLPAEEQLAAWREVLASAPTEQVTARLVEEVIARRASMSKEQFAALVQGAPVDVISARNRELRHQRTRESFHSKESFEWYSPPDPVEKARELMGEIDLDPASSPEANELIRAARILTAADNGLAQGWNGRVWLNWPGGLNEDDESNAKLWSEKLLAEYASGRTTEAVCLLFNAATDRGWFRPLWEHALCFTYGRWKFRRPGGEVGNQPLQPNAVVYLGPQLARFRELFAPLGRIVVPHQGFSEAMP